MPEDTSRYGMKRQYIKGLIAKGRQVVEKEQFVAKRQADLKKVQAAQGEDIPVAENVPY